MPVLDLLFMLFMMFHLLKIIRTLALLPLPLLMPTNLPLAHLPWLQQIRPPLLQLTLQILLPHLTPLTVALAVAMVILKLRTPSSAEGSGEPSEVHGLEDLESWHNIISICHLISGLLKFKRNICKLL